MLNKLQDLILTRKSLTERVANAKFDTDKCREKFELALSDEETAQKDLDRVEGQILSFVAQCQTESGGKQK
jgi:hypothetical protein